MADPQTFSKGISFFTSDGEEAVKTDLSCLACGVKLHGKKFTGASSSVEAMAGVRRSLWDYSCPNVGTDGHYHLVMLVQEMTNIHSDRIRAIIHEELLEKRRELLKRVRRIEGRKKA